MSGAIETIPIRLELTARLNPPVSPVDANTGLIPQVWRGAGLSVDVGIFQTNGVGADMQNFDYLEADIYPLPIPNSDEDTTFTFQTYSNLPFATVPGSPLISATVTAENITRQISRAGWASGCQQTARLEFTFIQTQSLALDGYPKQRFWMVIHGLTLAKSRVVFGAGPIDVYESGANTIYLPNNAAPIRIPDGTTFYVMENQQIPFATNIIVDGTLLVDGLLQDIQPVPV